MINGLSERTPNTPRYTALKMVCLPESGPVIAKLQEVEVRLACGETAAAAARAVGVTEQSYYRWRKEYGGL